MDGQRVRTQLARRIIADQGGSITVEYAVLLVAVALTCVLATVTLGAPLVKMFLTRETWLLMPFP